MERGTPTKHEGVTKLATGQFYVRVRMIDPKTGKRVEAARTLPPDSGEMDFAATKGLLREALSPTTPDASRTRFLDYAHEVIEARTATGKIASPETKMKYQGLLKNQLKDKWGDVFIDAITRRDVERWMVELGKSVTAGKYTPETVNTWFNAFRMIMRRAAAAFDIKDPTWLVESIPKSLGPRTYTDEEPNSLLPSELPGFFDAAWNLEREHFAMLVLGTLTGRRACELRPLRREGRPCDIDWATGTLKIRRSQTIGEALDVTKTKKDVQLFLPPTLLDILRTHVANLTPYRRGSVLLFPPRHPCKENTAGFMSKSALDKPIRRICAAAGITKHLTAKGAMRRTYQDLCRAAEVNKTVQMAMSGHATESMMELYSSAAADEKRNALMRMSDIAGLKAAARL